MRSSPNIIRMINSRRMKWGGRALRKRRVHTGVWLGKHKENILRKLRDNINIDLRRMEWECGLN
jgi:hypothetical protein